MASTYVICDATGNVGSKVAKSLLAAGVPVRAVGYRHPPGREPGGCHPDHRIFVVAAGCHAARCLPAARFSASMSIFFMPINAFMAFRDFSGL